MSTPAPLQQASGTSVPVSAYLLTLCIGIIGSNSLLLAPIAPVVAISFAASVPAVMLAASAFGLGTALSALFLARYIDVCGAFRSLKLALLTLSASLLLSAVSPGLWVLVMSQLLVGVATGVAIPAIYVAAAHIAPPEQVKKTLGIVLVGWTLSLVAGVSFSSFAAERISWRYIYLALSLLNLLSLSTLHLRVKGDTPKIARALSPLGMLKNKTVTRLLIICIAIMTSFYGVYGFLGDYIFSVLQQPLRANGAIAILYGIGFGSVAFFSGGLKHFCENMKFSVTLLLLGLSYALIFLSYSYLTIAIAMTLLGCINHIAVNNLISKIQDAAGDEKGSAMGLNSAVTYFSVFLSSSVFGLLYSACGFKTLVLSACVLCLAASLFSQRTLR